MIEPLVTTISELSKSTTWGVKAKKTSNSLLEEVIGPLISTRGERSNSVIKTLDSRLLAPVVSLVTEVEGKVKVTVPSVVGVTVTE